MVLDDLNHFPAGYLDNMETAPNGTRSYRSYLSCKKWR
ncbi:hypothetical protein LMG23994_07151 [Cupriavidus pinatubonensis]|uniref:Uncharacterized protein n=1 Tax=Cupriavidus pinatubonensis TaxID=248026 RepID=A0ABM8Y4J0_9BURK|nr:hypothetical protein LMG23994_07151 [Cupriavidus pinatubonensis]